MHKPPRERTSAGGYLPQLQQAEARPASSQQPLWPNIIHQALSTFQTHLLCHLRCVRSGQLADSQRIYSRAELLEFREDQKQVLRLRSKQELVGIR